MLLLHGEQYLELSRPFPTSGEVVTTSRIIDVLDKGKAALLVIGMTTCEAKSGEVIAENETTVYIRGSGGFGKSECAPIFPVVASMIKHMSLVAAVFGLSSDRE